jgi:hypothetical protein
MADRLGGCLCGLVRYKLKSEPEAIAVCHCTHCQKQSGSVFSFNLFINEEDYEQQGQTQVYLDIGDSGEPSYRHFCGSCGSPITTRVSLMPGKVLVKAGTLDSMDGLQPQIEIYTDRSVKWLHPIDGTHRFPLSPG